MGIHDDIALNLQRFMQVNNVSATSIASIAGVRASSITRFISRDIKSLKIEILQKIASYYNQPLSIFINDLSSPREEILPDAEILSSKDIVFIDFYQDIGVSAGCGMVCESDGNISSFPLPKTFLNLQGIDADNAVIVKVNGDSMHPTLNDGDLVIVNKNYISSLSGIYVIKDDINGLRVKRLNKDKEGNLQVISDNKKYPVQIYTNEELYSNTLTIIGKVAAKIAGI